MPEKSTINATTSTYERVQVPLLTPIEKPRDP